MAWYRTFIRGENFFFETEGKVQRFGFYTNRFVEAMDRHQAENEAVALLRTEPKLRGSQNNPGDPPMLYVEEIVEIDSDDVPSRQHGLVLFVAETNA